ncbi:DegT/DnrJ/EryC1/StrS family aminotransferase [Virgisporangium aurantiacum]|uniref:3-amino-5-hydroxybenzoate synthase n=1 Tax=Virgisporangium aurantiacum TaxID=175570 RepID=A0A8J3Z587_9ACTN|nr:DegT/DnrJ/EryC1/StrS family aminotransferase [Virgisporangium aurantiacum]GIJ57769.1 3-amino-5-hydroxybenzoate synthase [Virgisporangium aurantiacum]
MTLAIDGGTPVRDRPWPAWPPPLDAEQRRLLLTVVDSGRWGATQGPYSDEFARRFAAACDAPHGVPLANGTLALFVALRALGVGPGDEVVVPAYTFVACATSVLLAGAVPVIVDVDPVHLHLDADAARAAIGPRTAAVLPVHLAGSPADLDPLLALAARHGLAVIEDCAQAHGAAYRGRPVGGLGDAGTFSFQSSKAMTAGEGGLVVCRRPEVHDRVWTLCNVGRRRGGAWYEHPEVGWNLRLTELQAALLLPWLDRLDAEIDRRNAFARAVSVGLREAGVPVEVVPPPPGTTRDTRHLLMLRLSAPLDPDQGRRVIAAAAAEGLPLGRGYPPLGTVPAVANGPARVTDCPGADAASRQVFWLEQRLLMADLDEATDVVAVLAKVLA